MEKEIISLDKISVGKKVIVKKMLSTGSIRRRLQDIGIIEKTMLECLQKSPSGDPIAYFIRGAVIAIRIEDLKNILVIEV